MLSELCGLFSLATCTSHMEQNLRNKMWGLPSESLKIVIESLDGNDDKSLRSSKKALIGIGFSGREADELLQKAGF